MSEHEQAAEILIRVFNTLAAANGKRLNATHKAEIRRACELLATDGTLSPLDDIAKPEQAEYVPASAAIPRDWMERKRERER